MAERRSEKNPCRHIPFDVSGETLDSLYRDNDQNEIEETVGDWRRAAMQRLEEERMVVQRDRNKHFDPKPRNVKRSPSLQTEHPKCANPACQTAFRWTAGGKFFRFRPDPISAAQSNSTIEAPCGIRNPRCEALLALRALLTCSHSGV
jgi:hypothetical protein